MRLLQIGFRDFDTYKLLQANQVVAAAPVYGGSKAEVPLVVKQDVTRIMSREARDGMKVTVDFNAPLKAPVRPNTEVGKLTINVPDGSTTVLPVYTAEAVRGMGPVTAIGAGVKHLFLMALGESEVPAPSGPTASPGAKTPKS
jgi:D-alanyl-D-alanine carboxypeptidase (penicillin-binding protein 5/6)